jgi:hypothetical protein
MARSAGAGLSLLGGLLVALVLVGPSPADGRDVSATRRARDARGEVPRVSTADRLYERIGLEGVLDRAAFAAAHARLVAEDPTATTLAVADMRRPSTEQRLVLLDLAQARVLLRTWVAHGSGSGGLLATRFGNRPDSHQTSLGLYRVGARIRSPKHGPALLLDGLDPGRNDRARAREIIIHAADYVSAAFIAQTGRLGRSWGCPAVPRDQMAAVLEAFADGGYLFVHGA